MKVLEVSNHLLISGGLMALNEGHSDPLKGSLTPEGVLKMDADRSRVLAGFGLSLAGMSIQIFNIAYAIRHVMQRPTIFNIVLMMCLSLFLISFWPMLCIL